MFRVIRRPNRNKIDTTQSHGGSLASEQQLRFGSKELNRSIFLEFNLQLGTFFHHYFELICFLTKVSELRSINNHIGRTVYSNFIRDRDVSSSIYGRRYKRYDLFPLHFNLVIGKDRRNRFNFVFTFEKYVYIYLVYGRRNAPGSRNNT